MYSTPGVGSVLPGVGSVLSGLGGESAFIRETEGRTVFFEHAPVTLFFLSVVLQRKPCAAVVDLLP